MAVTKSSRRKFAAAAVLISMAVALVMAEAAARVASTTFRRMHDKPQPFFQKDPRLGYSLVPGYDGMSSWGVRFRVNSLGFRGPEIDREKPARVFRVLIVGDSIVMGSGLAEQSVVSTQLQTILSARDPSRKYQVINAGVSGYGIREYRMVLEDQVPRLKPDAVVMVVTFNDVPGVIPADLIHPMRDTPFSGRLGPLNDFALVFIVRDLYNRIGLDPDTSLATFFSAEHHPPTMARIENAWKLFDAEFSRAAEFCRKSRVPLIVIASPHAAQFGDPSAPRTFQTRLAGLSEKQGVLFLDPFPEFAALPKPPYIVPDPIHPSPEGHLIFARLIAEQIEKAPIPPQR